MTGRNKIRWAILGCARIAERAIIPAIRQSKTGQLYGIASRDYRKAKNWVKQYGFQKAYPDYQSLLDDPDINAVYIPLPNHLHSEWTCRAAKSGKHILCEKPMAMTEKEIHRMIKETDKTNVNLMEAFMYRFHPQHEKVFRLIESGEIGDIQLIRSSFSFNYTGDSDNYRWNPKMGGGALYDVGCYAINATRLILGKEPISVYASADYDTKGKIDLSYSLLLEFSGHQTALIYCSFKSQFQNEYEILGTRGRIRVPRAFSLKDKNGIIELLKGDNLRIISIPPANQYRLMIDHFADSIRKNRLPRFTGDDALYNIRVIEAAQKSVQQGRPVRLKSVEKEIRFSL